MCFTSTTRKLRSRFNVFDPVHFQCHCQPRIKSLAFAMPFLRRFPVCKEKLSTLATADRQPCPNTVAPGQAHAPMEADRIKRIQHRPLSQGLVYGSLDLSSVGDVGLSGKEFAGAKTLLYLLSTPEAWVPTLGASTHRFPYLWGAGRLIIKDAVMLGAAVVTLADSARTWWARNP